MDLDGSMNGYIVDNEAVMLVVSRRKVFSVPRVSHSTIRIITEGSLLGSPSFFSFFFRIQIMNEICVIISMEVSLFFIRVKYRRYG